MLSVSCREVGVDCDYVGKGETENELMDNLIEHAITDHGYTREDVLKPEMQEKIKEGEKVSFNGSTFSIFHDGPVVFKTEDCLVENSVFEWQQYKQERMFDRVNIAEQKMNLKVGASLEDAGAPEK